MGSQVIEFVHARDVNNGNTQVLQCCGSMSPLQRCFQMTQVHVWSRECLHDGAVSVYTMETIRMKLINLIS